MILYDVKRSVKSDVIDEMVELMLKKSFLDEGFMLILDIDEIMKSKPDCLVEKLTDILKIV